MAKFKFFGISEADAEIKSADSAINLLLVGAKITTIEVSGKPLPATSDAVPLALKIAAYAGTVKEGSGDYEAAQMAANNQILADQARELTAKLTTEQTTVATLSREKLALEQRVTVLEATQQNLTASNAELTELRKASNAEAGRVTGQLNAINSELSRRCLAVGCLVDLRDDKGQLLASTATADEKQAAAERISVADKLNLFNGAVNAAMNRMSLNVSALPAQPGSGTNGQRLSLSSKAVLDQYAALTDPVQKTAFYRANKAVIDAAYDSQTN